MRKVIKILVKLLSAAVLLLIILPVSVSLLLDIPSVQNYIVHKAADFASRKLETRVSIDRVNIGLFNKVNVHGFYVEDYQRDTLLYVGSLRAFITGFGLFGEGLGFSYGKADSVKLYMVETPDSVMNIKQVIDRISRKEGKGNFRMVIRQVEVTDVDLRIERLEHRNPPHGVDYGNMHLYDMNGRVNGLTIAGSSIMGDIEEFSFTERSGFVANGMTGTFRVDRGLIALDNLDISTDRSSVHLERLTLSGGDWSAYRDFVHNVRIDAVVRNTVLSSDDVGYFSPGIASWKTSFEGLEMNMAGTVADFTGSISNVVVDGSGRLRADVSAAGLPDFRNTDFSINLKHLDIEPDELERLAANVAHAEIPQSALDIIRRSDRLSLSGKFAGIPSSFRTHGTLDTGAGKVDFNAVMRHAGGARRSMGATLASPSLDLGQLLGSQELGTTGFVLAANGMMGGGHYGFSVNGDVTGLSFHDYVYDRIRIDGRVADGDVDAAVAVHDRSLDLDLKAALGLGGDRPTYDMVMNLHRADLVALQVNRRDSVSVLSADIGLSAAGRIPDEVSGELSVADARYRYNDSEIVSEYMSLTMQSNEDLRSLKLTSDFADAVFESRNDYREVMTYLKEVVGQHMPLLYEVYADNGSPAAAAALEHGREHGFSMLSITTKNFNPVADALSKGLQVADNSEIQMLMDPVCNTFMMRAKSDYIERNRMLATSLNLNVVNRSDTLAMRLRAGDLYVGTMHMPDLSLRCGLVDNRADITGEFNDTIQQFSGHVNMGVVLAKDTVTNNRSIDIRFAPSYFQRKNNRWNLSSDRISADSSRIVVDNFTIRNDRQELLINGVASRSRSDSLVMRLNNFDLAPFAQILQRIGYSVEGRTNGYASVKSALKGSEIAANIRLDSVEVNTIHVPSLEFDSQWDFELNRARFTLSTQAKRDTVIRGFYAPSQVRYYARLKTDSLDMALLDPVLEGVVSDTHGTAAADLVFTGQRREADLSGDIVVSNLNTTVDFTQVTYNVPKADIKVRNNRFAIDSVAVYDSEHNRGRLSFELSLNHLSNISYKLNVQPQRMLVLNTTSQDNDYFYGKVYASGAATIVGDKSGVNMDIVASTDNNTQFFLPLSGKSDVSTADFVIFEKANKPDTTNYLVRKKLMFERRQRQRSSSSGRMDINLALDVRPNAMFQLVIDPTVGDVIKGRGEGALNLHINPKSNIFEMYGDYNIIEGSYLFTLQNIINKKFIIEEGSSIQWTGEPVDAMLNIDAVYKLKASLQPLLAGSVSSTVSTRAVPVECIINLSDRLTKPTVTFDVVVPNADPDVQAVVANALSTPESRSQQFLYLLVANSFISEATTGSSSNIGVTASAATGFELLSNQLSNWLSADDYNIVIRYRPKTDVASDEVDFGFSTELINNRLLLEVEGNYLVDKSMAVNNQMSNLMGEAYLTWLIDRAGNLRLKGFTHTIDRFDENQGLQETGIGIYYKESFNNLKDLKQRVRDRFTNRRRKARREARRQARLEARERDIQSREDDMLPAADDPRDIEDDYMIYD